MKKTLVLFFTIFLCVMNGACLTTMMYQSKKTPLNETLTGFLVTEDQQKLIFVGQHYHYIFPLPYDLKNILAWSGRGKLEAKNLHFVISKGNVINGSYSLAPIDSRTLTDDDRQFLLIHRFGSGVNLSNPSFIYNGQLSQGTVYDAGHFQLPSVVAFNKPYHLSIYYDYSSATVGKILLTPLTIAADGVITVVGVAAAVVIAPIALVDMAVHH